MKDERVVSLKEVIAEIDAMPPVKAEGHDFIEKTCLKTRLELLSSVDAIPVALLEDQVKQILAENKPMGNLLAMTLNVMLRWWKERDGNEAD